MTHERAEQLLSSCERPVRRVPLQERLQGQRAEKPPEDAVGEAPAQTRSVPADVALKKQSERRSDDHSDDKVQRLSKSGRGGSHQAGDKRKEMRFRHPLSEGPAADDTSEPSRDKCACETELQRQACRLLCSFALLRARLWRRLSHGQSAEHQTERRPKDEQVTNQFGKVCAGGVKHSH